MIAGRHVRRGIGQFYGAMCGALAVVVVGVGLSHPEPAALIMAAIIVAFLTRSAYRGLTSQGDM